ncbi:MAG TPA: hypothetical protein VIH90_02920 [Candidatus Saccharimonadales bacterium]
MVETLSDEILEGAFRVGSDLASPDQDIDSAVWQLNINLAAIGCEPTVDAAQVRGSWQSAMLASDSPPFTRAIRGATLSVIWRPESLADTLPPIGSTPASKSGGVVWVEAKDLNLEEAAHQATEGSVWVDPAAAEHRASYAERNSLLLKGFLGGLASQGYARPKAKEDMCQEFDEILDSLWRRGSYHCFSESKVIASMMRKTGLGSPAGTVKAIRRFHSFGKGYGFDLALTRLLPDSLLAELD